MRLAHGMRSNKNHQITDLPSGSYLRPKLICRPYSTLSTQAEAGAHVLRAALPFDGHSLGCRLGRTGKRMQMQTATASCQSGIEDRRAWQSMTGATRRA